MITIDEDQGIVSEINANGENRTFPIGTPEAFALISKSWLRAGWDNKYVYSFTWQGRPVIQLPEDMLRIQEVIFSVSPDVIIETGVAHGGSLVYYAGLCKIAGKGRVVGIDIEIRPHNRVAIEAHPLFSYITLIEGSSIDASTVERVKSLVHRDEKVIVLLDSRHTKEHVLAELQAYAPLVSVGSYIVAMDGIMGEVVGAPRTEPDWIWNNPKTAAEEFVKENPSFQIKEPELVFNEGSIIDRVTYWPGGFIKRIS